MSRRFSKSVERCSKSSLPHILPLITNNQRRVWPVHRLFPEGAETNPCSLLRTSGIARLPLPTPSLSTPSSIPPHSLPAPSSLTPLATHISLPTLFPLPLTPCPLPLTPFPLPLTPCPRPARHKVDALEPPVKYARR